jgi:sterol desaturase/sphingolipid hydroxylase (fatty acid hydroxylase superfamily)
MTGLAVAFGLLVRWMPCNPGMAWWKDLRATITDLFYWLVAPLILRLASLVLLFVGLMLFFNGNQPHCLPVQDLPWWQQCLLILVLQDIFLYWMHRIFHTGLAWKFHAVHHSPTVLDWMSTTRMHLINHLFTITLAEVLLLLLGFPATSLALLVPFNILYSALVHANLNWTFGPLRYVFASPVFHRWHHTTQEEGRDKNFASTFPILDVIFGTFYMPPDQLPARFGTGEADFPTGFWGQLLHPLWTTNPDSPGLLVWAWRRPVTVLAVCGLVLAVGGSCWTTLDHKVAQLQEAERQAREVALPPQPLVLAVPADGQRVIPVRSVAGSRTGSLFACGNEAGQVKVWDGNLGKEVLSLNAHRRCVRCLAVTADGKRLVTGSQDCTLKVWDLETGQEEGTLVGHRSFVVGLALSGAGKTLVSASPDGMVKVWDVSGGQGGRGGIPHPLIEKRTLQTDGDVITSVAISEDGRRIVTASGPEVTVWDGEKGTALRVLRGHTNLVYCVALSPDGKTIVSGSFDTTLKIWDADTGTERQTLTGHTGPIYSVVIREDGKRIVSGSKDATVKVWDADTGQELRTHCGHRDAVTSVALSDGGQRIISGSQDGTVHVWSTESATVEHPVSMASPESRSR